MKKVIFVLLLCVLIFQNAALAKTDYDNGYKYDKMDDVFRFDTGDFLKGHETGGNKSEISEAVRITNALGFTEIVNPDELLSYDAYVKTLLKLSKNDDNAFDTLGKKENITMGTVLKDIDDILGYGDKPVYSIAENTKLLKNLHYKGEALITNRDFAQLVWNALNSKYIVTNCYSDTKQEYKKSDDVMLNGIFKIYKISGFMDAIPQMSVFSPSHLAKDHVRIDRNEYAAGDTDAEQYFGMRVKGYAHYDDSKDEYVLKYVAAENSDDCVTVNCRDINSITALKAEYEDGKGNEEKIDISRLGYLTINGEPSDISKINEAPKSEGIVTFSKSNKNGYFDVAVFEKTGYFTVYSVDAYDKKINLRYGASCNGNSNISLENAKVLICSKDGASINYTEIKPDDVIRVVANSDFSYVKINVYSNRKGGIVTQISDDVVSIGNKDYYIARTYSAAPEYKEIKVGGEGTFFVSEDGYIAGFKAKDSMKYGYFKEVADDKIGGVSVQLFTQEGKWKVYSLKNKVDIDGKTIQGDAAMNILSAQKGTIIRYEVSGMDELSSIDTLNENPEESGDQYALKLAYAGNVEQSWRGGKWFRSDPGYRFKDDAVLFNIPDDMEKKNDYSVRPSSFLSNDETNISVEMYIPDEFGLCSVGVVSGAIEAIATETTWWFYIESVSAVLTNDGENGYGLNGYRMKNGIVDFEKASYTITQEVKEKIEKATPGAIAPGSLMRITADSNDEIANAETAFTNANPQVGYVDEISGYYQHLCGTVEAADPSLSKDGYIKVNAGGSSYVFEPQNIILIHKNDKKGRQIFCGDVLVGDIMYVFRAAGDGRVCAVVR